MSNATGATRGDRRRNARRERRRVIKQSITDPPVIKQSITDPLVIK